MYSYSDKIRDEEINKRVEESKKREEQERREFLLKCRDDLIHDISIIRGIEGFEHVDEKVAWQYYMPFRPPNERIPMVPEWDPVYRWVLQRYPDLLKLKSRAGITFLVNQYGLKEVYERRLLLISELTKQLKIAEELDSCNNHSQASYIRSVVVDKLMNEEIQPPLTDSEIKDVEYELKDWVKTILQPQIDKRNAKHPEDCWCYGCQDKRNKEESKQFLEDAIRRSKKKGACDE